MQPSFFLPIFICFDTVRSLTVYAVLRSGLPLPPAAISLCAEAFKLLCAIALHFRYLAKDGRTGDFVSSLVPMRLVDGRPTRNWASVARMSAPAALYLINNVLYLVALKFTSPALVGMAMLAKLPFTAILHWLAFRRARCSQAWISLTILCLGLLGLHLPWQRFYALFLGDGEAVRLDDLLPDMSDTAWYGSVIGLAIAAISSCTSIVTEVLMKQDVDFWVVQIWLYFYGTVLAGVAMFLGADRAGSPSIAPTSSMLAMRLAQLAVIVITGLTGIVVANILRKGDNLVKLVGGSAAVVATLVVQPFVFPELWSQTFNPCTILAVGCVMQATWTYNYYKDCTPASHSRIRLPEVPEKLDIEMSLADGDEIDIQRTESAQSWMVPTWQKLSITSGCFILVAVALSLWG